MKGMLTLVVVVALWLILQIYVLPRLGVST